MPDAVTSVFTLFYAGFTLMALPALREEADGPRSSLICSALSGLVISRRSMLAARGDATNSLQKSQPW